MEVPKALLRQPRDPYGTHIRAILLNLRSVSECKKSNSDISTVDTQIN
jgi:hypothetical protein